MVGDRNYYNYNYCFMKFLEHLRVTLDNNLKYSRMCVDETLNNRQGSNIGKFIYWNSPFEVYFSKTIDTNFLTYKGLRE